MADHGSHSASHAASHDDHGGTKKYWLVFGALCVLTTMSFFTYSSLWPFKDTPAVGWAFMMAVSCTKAMLVMLFFMHLLWEASWKYVLTVPASIMSVFLCLALVGDIGQRTRYYSEERWLNAATPTVTADHGEHGQEHSTEKNTKQSDSKKSKAKSADMKTK